MMAVAGAAIGATLAAGAIISYAGTERAIREAPTQKLVGSAEAHRSIALGVVGAVVAWLVTGWPALGILGGGAAVVVPALIEARRAKQYRVDKTDALATWTEMLHDTVSSHAGIYQALSTSCEVAPELIRPNIEAMLRRAERGSLVDALRSFATEMADPVSDMVVAALVIAIEGRAKDLPQLLAEIAASARRQASMHLRVETGRARTYAQARSLVGITLIGSVGLMLFAPQFMYPYNSFVGQLVLAGICAMFATALWLLIALSQPAQSLRLLGGVAKLDTLGGAS